MPFLFPSAIRNSLALLFNSNAWLLNSDALLRWTVLRCSEAFLSYSTSPQCLALLFLSKSLLFRRITTACISPAARGPACPLHRCLCISFALPRLSEPLLCPSNLFSALPVRCGASPSLCTSYLCHGRSVPGCAFASLGYQFKSSATHFIAFPVRFLSLLFLSYAIPLLFLAFLFRFSDYHSNAVSFNRVPMGFAAAAARREALSRCV